MLLSGKKEKYLLLYVESGNEEYGKSKIIPFM